MRKLFIIATSAGLMACATMAGTGYGTRVTTGTNTSATAAWSQTIRGAVDTVYVAAQTNGILAAAATGTVHITYAPHNAAAAQTLLTNAVTGSAAIRPRVAVDDVQGEAITDPLYERAVLAGEPVSISVTGSTTGVVWYAVIVTD
jgi:hypothetical protein